MRDKNIDVPWAMKYFRNKLGMTQGDICRATGFERAYVSKLETGRIPYPRLSTCLRLARAFNVTVGEFVEVASMKDAQKAEEYLSGAVLSEQ